MMHVMAFSVLAAGLVSGGAARLASESLTPSPLDGKVVAPRDYKGSLEESAQEAILILREERIKLRSADGRATNREGVRAVQDLVVKIDVKSDAALASFGWVLPFPSTPQVFREDAAIFRELFDYVQRRKARVSKGARGAKLASGEAKAKGVEVLERKFVGSFDVAIVREKGEGRLNAWLEQEGFQTLKDAEDVLGFYRRKNYVFACIKVRDAALDAKKARALHPLRFTFSTGGRDALYFPMKMTGLQSAPFDVNLYVFRPSWINDKLNRYGFVHRGFRLMWRDYDSKTCKANAGKTWSSPADDAYLAPFARKLEATTRFFQKLHPGERFYLTNLQARQLRPEDVRQWRDDLWLFPYYTDRAFVPYDARAGACASELWHSAKAGK